jgi:putative nucleotidyltransferase with HDIG domain
MSAKSILLAVADAQALADITQALGDGWESISAANEADALAQLEQRTFDALLVDFNLGSPDASQLLDQALAKRPETIRFLLAHEADLALVAAYVSGPHEILPKPVEPASLKSRIERGVAPTDPNHNQSEGDLGASASASPAVPAVYAEVLKALDLPDVTKRQVGEIIAADAALTAEVLGLTKSAYLGLPGNVTDPVQAVEALGLETVKALVMALRFLAEHSQLKPGYLSLEKMWQHSTNVAHRARDLMLFETKDRALAAEALVAGLLHDLGKVVLASNFDDLYGRVHSLARKQPVALWDIEKEMFGASHGEIGACLVGMWNMPSSVVQAVAFHHEPPVGEDQHLTPLAAVHIANVLEHEIQSNDEFQVAPVISMALLNDIGLLQRLPVWRAVFANRRDASASPQVEPAETSVAQLLTPPLTGTPPLKPNELPTPTAATRTATLGQPGSEDGTSVAPAFHQRRWVYAGAAAAVLGFLALWLGTQPQPEVRARPLQPILNQAPAVASPASAPESASAAMTEATQATAVSDEWLAPDTILDANLATSLSESAPTVADAPQVAPTNAPPPALATKERASPEFRLSGLMYTVTRPVAIVNGQTVCVGDRVSGATVSAIDRNHVTLQINGRQVRLFLKESD